ncbi:lactate utilization protein C [Rubrobacter tropicus]|uniref:Lactate utilization protein C n=1 Tax=Rubrobacter tropicus TaxID=2653851 RepID=A0A6G8QBT5_9ACTN|nr:LUD domain-containing protein [Rubrobacter tropicus]QIN83955.1 lactate utilization protein C [Rubrobacter tropicus]
MASAKETILWRVRRATRDVPEDERPEDVAVARGYRKEGEDARAEVVDRFAAHVAEYEATVHRVAEDDLPGVVEKILAGRGIQRLVVPPKLPQSWVPDGVEVLRDAARPRLTNEELDGADGVLTGCALGIAQTGTIALDAGPGQGRRALTLLPDYHLCVVREEQVVDLVPEAFAKLEEAVGVEGRAVTFISGPSATSDIELNRVEGVHGPRVLEVLIVG